MTAIVTCPKTDCSMATTCSHGRPHEENRDCELAYMCRSVDCLPVNVVIVKDEVSLDEQPA